MSEVTWTRDPYGAAKAATSSGDTKKVFIAGPKLYIAGPERGEMPQQIFAAFSVVSLCLIVDGRPATGNLSVKEAERMIAKSRHADFFESDLETAQEAAGDELSPAYTFRFGIGELKGKSPAEVILENPENGPKILRSQYDFLKKNLERYPKNQEGIDAIMDASRLLKAGELKKQEGGTQGARKPLVLIATPPKGSARKKREDGMSPCYEVSIRWDFGYRLPVEVALENYYAPIQVMEGGRQNILKREMDKNSYVKNAMRVSADDWRDVAEKCALAISGFAAAHRLGIEKNIEKADNHAREAAGYSTRN